MTTTHQERSAAEAIYAGLGLTVIAMLSRTSTMPPPTCWPATSGPAIPHAPRRVSTQPSSPGSPAATTSPASPDNEDSPVWKERHELASATEDDVASIYPAPTHQRLAAVKRRYDPGNLFTRNHNVRPQ